MHFLAPIKISYRNLMAAKLRSFLTILGIIIGVASVIVIMAIGQSAQQLILSQISSVGSNLVGIMPGASDEEGPPAAMMGITITTLKYADLEAIRNNKKVPEASAAAGYVMGTATAERDGSDVNAAFTGTTASYVDVENTEIAQGRFFSKDEETNLARVAVLGETIAQEIFGLDDPLNKVFKLKDQNFVVIGVLKKRGAGSFGFSSQDDSVFIPVKTAQELLLGINHLGYIRVKVSDPTLIPSAIANMKTTLREQHDIDDPANDDFSVRDQASALDTITTVTDVLRYFLLAIGTISLVVGGVGIMNTMLIAVNQRIREVGLRKAIGARNSDVLFQFMAESIFISLVGGLIGIVLGVTTAYLVAVVMQRLSYTWPFLITFQSIGTATGVSIIIGMIFGLYPARKASQISPMEALRYE